MITACCNKDQDYIFWNNIENANKPHVRAFWLGNRVDRENLSEFTQDIYDGGFGGVEFFNLSDIYDTDKPRIPYLSDEWVELMRFTLEDLKEKGLHGDLNLSTGWNLGGKWIPKELSASLLDIEKIPLNTSSINKAIDSSEKILTFLAVDENKMRIILDVSDIREGKLSRLNANGNWNLYKASLKEGIQKMRFPVPGEDGYTMDYLDEKAIKLHLSQYSQQLGELFNENLVRAVFNDSWEVTMNWTDKLFDEFYKQKHYRLEKFLPELTGIGNNDTIRRVFMDYRDVVAEMLIENYAVPFAEWTKANNLLLRNQVSATPGDELSLHILSDIAEADVGGSEEWLFTKNSHYRPDHFLPRIKFPLSAVSLTGKQLLSAEVFTCYGPHLEIDFEMLKRNADYCLAGGVNQMFYHGMAYSPDDEPYPGWMFWAATHFSKSNTLWRNINKFNNYVARCQSFLQLGSYDSDFLLYLPYFDYWAENEELHILPQASFDFSLLPVASELWNAGFCYDFISDRLLIDQIDVLDGQVTGPAHCYRTILVPDCNYIPLKTLEKLYTLAKAGADIVFWEKIPDDVPGLKSYDKRRESLNQLKNKIFSHKTSNADLKEYKIGKGRIMIINDFDILPDLNIKKEELLDSNLPFIRKKIDDEWIYFITNPERKKKEGWFKLDVQGKSVVILDPMMYKAGIAQSRKTNDKKTEVYLSIAPNKSYILKISNKKVNGNGWIYETTGDKGFSINNRWNVSFIDGGDVLPEEMEIDRLQSWTKFDNSHFSYKYFSGTAIYKTTFTVPKELRDTEKWCIDLGDVKNHARLRINGEMIDTLLQYPFQIVTDKIFNNEVNTIEVEVTNLTVNRVAGLEVKGIEWQNYWFGACLFKWTKKDESLEPLSSGLLGPVIISPSFTYYPKK